MQNTAVYAPITFEEIVMVMISNSNSNWTERSTIQGVIEGVIERVISKSAEREAQGRFEITSPITP